MQIYFTFQKNDTKKFLLWIKVKLFTKLKKHDNQISSKPSGNFIITVC